MSNRILLLPIIGLITFFTLLFLYTKFFGPIPFSVNSIVTTKTTTFDVTGEGKVTVKPDIASVTIGIEAKGATVKAAQDQINNTINSVSEAIKKIGVDSKDIKTINYSINPTYDYSASSQKITGFSANTSLQLKIRQIDKANQVIDQATANGANQVGGINFEVDDKTKAENEARQKAVDEAKRKASDAAKIAGFRLGKIVNYSENFIGFPVPMPMMRAQGAKDVLENPTKLESGSSEVIVTVTLSYEIW